MGFSGHAAPQTVVGVTIALTCLAAVVVFTRLFTRFFIARNPGLDDGFITLALLFSIATTVTMCLQVKWGMGEHIYNLTLHEIIESQKPFYVSVWVYNLAMSSTKYSILLQYLRIFPQPGFRRACFILMGVVTVYTFWTFFSAVFACWPISYFWNQLVKPGGGHCINRFGVWYANAGINIATDMATGILPLPVLKQLELPKRQKIALMVVFGLGGFTCIVSILRLESIYRFSQTKDVTWINPLAAIWSCVEINTGILCSCLPTLKGIVTRIFPRLLGTLRSGSAGEGRSHKRGYHAHSSPSNSTPNQSNGSSRGKMSFDALGRGLTGRGQPVQNSHVRGQAGGSSESIEFVNLGAGPRGHEVDDGQIQVVTTVEQDVEKISDYGSYHEVEGMRGSMQPSFYRSGSI